MTWDAYHRRNEVLRDVAATADRRRDGVLPWDELEAARAAFDSPTDLLLALHMRWNTRLRAHAEAELDAQPADLGSAASRAWRNASADLPGTRAILDAQQNNPALAEARKKELAFLASVAGLAAPGDLTAAVHGQRIVADGRAITLDRQRPAGHRGGLVHRVRQALVA
ncbi:MAG: hypothetical protein ACRDO7_11595 [Nocardioidaceae bacterium]